MLQKHALQKAVNIIASTTGINLIASDVWSYNSLTRTLRYRAEDLKTLSEMASTGILLHETAHAIHTPARDYAKDIPRALEYTKVFGWLFNVFENWRIERQFAKTFKRSPEYFTKALEETLHTREYSSFTPDVFKILDQLDIQRYGREPDRKILAKHKDIHAQLETLVEKFADVTTLETREGWEILDKALQVLEPILTKEEKQNSLFRMVVGKDATRATGQPVYDHTGLPPQGIAGSAYEDLDPQSAQDYKQVALRARQDTARVKKALERLALKAQKVYKVKNLKRGKLNLRKAHKIAMGKRNIFFKRQDEKITLPPVGILLDLSGSMYGENITYSLASIVMLSEALKELKTPYVIAGFSNEAKIYKAFKDPVKNNVLQNLMQDFGGGTNDHIGIDLVAKELPAGGLMFVVTDGYSNDNDLQLKAITKAKEKGIKVAGISLCGEGAIANYPIKIEAQRPQLLPDIIKREIVKNSK